MKIEIEARMMRAALICAAKSDIRYYLNGIAIEVHGERVLVLATDGHRLFVGRNHAKPRGNIEEGAQTYIVPRDLVERALRSLPRNGIGFGLDFTFPVTSPGEVSIKAIDAGFTGNLIDGRFPEWRRAIVKRTSKESGQFKPKYVADCQRVADCFRSNSNGESCVDIAHNGPDSAALVTFSTTADAFVVLTPMRSFEARSVKDWLRQETGVQWDMPDPEVQS